MQAVLRACRFRHVLGQCSSSLSGGVRPVASKGLSCRAHHCGPPPGWSLLAGEPSCRAHYPCLSRACRCQELPHCPALSTLGSLSSSSPPSVSTNFVCPSRLWLVSRQKFCVQCPRLCHVVVHGTAASAWGWCDDPEYFAVPLNPGGRATCSSRVSPSQRRAGCLLEPGRKEMAPCIRFQPCGSSSWQMVPGLRGSEAGDSGVTLVLLPQGFGQGLKHDSGRLHF